MGDQSINTRRYIEYPCASFFFKMVGFLNLVSVRMVGGDGVDLDPLNTNFLYSVGCYLWNNDAVVNWIPMVTLFKLQYYINLEHCQYNVLDIRGNTGDVGGGEEEGGGRRPSRGGVDMRSLQGVSPRFSTKVKR